MKIKLVITKDEIARGYAKNCHSGNNCPVHRALKPFIKSKFIVSANGSFITFYEKRMAGLHGSWFVSSQKMGDWVERYDDLSKPNLTKEVEFTVNIPDMYLKKTVLSAK